MPAAFNSTWRCGTDGPSFIEPKTHDEAVQPLAFARPNLPAELEANVREPERAHLIVSTRLRDEPDDCVATLAEVENLPRSARGPKSRPVRRDGDRDGRSSAGKTEDKGDDVETLCRQDGLVLAGGDRET